MTKKLIVANWKMNPQTGKEAERILAGYKKQLKANSYKLKADIVICPPFVYLDLISKKLTSASWRIKATLGAQDIFWSAGGRTPAGGGAFTGEVSSGMLLDAGCKYVIVGHSERRKYLGETEEMVNKKLLAALKAGLSVILCVGERHRENPKEIPLEVEKQVIAALSGVSKSFIDKIIVAYEPVWAIGTGTPDTPEGAMMAAVLIRKVAINILGNGAKDLRVLYGGSVNSQNAKNFINHEGIDGVLVGGASLDSKEFAGILMP